MTHDRLNLPGAPMKLAYEVEERVAHDPAFTARVLEALAYFGEHNAFRQLLLHESRELAGDDPDLQQRFITMGCAILAAASDAKTWNEAREIYDHTGITSDEVRAIEHTQPYEQLPPVDNPHNEAA